MHGPDRSGPSSAERSSRCGLIRGTSRPRDSTPAALRWPVDSFDEVLVFAHIKLENQTKDPLFLQDILANATLGDGILSVSAGNAAQYEEVFIAYPELAALHTTCLAPRTMIAPGQKLDGTASGRSGGPSRSGTRART